MLKLRELKTDVWELTLDGVIAKSDIETMERELTPVLRGEGPLGLIVRAEGLKDLTADAIAADAKFEIGMLGQWSTIGRMAIVTDLQAIAALMRWIDPILPMIEMKAFCSDEVAGAEAFVSDLPARRSDSGKGGIRLLSDGEDGVVAYEIDGRITVEDVDEVMAQIEARLEGTGTFDLLVRFRSFDGFDPAILANGSLLGTKMDAIKRLRRYAVVGAPKWMAAMAGTVGAVMPFEMKSFDAAEEEAAWIWVRAH